MRKLIAIGATVAYLAASTAFADQDTKSSAQQQGPLAPGSSAGLQKAQDTEMNTTLLLIGAAVVAGGLCLALCSSGGNHSTATTTGNHN